jgi:hypothetical protein
MAVLLRNLNPKRYTMDRVADLLDVDRLTLSHAISGKTPSYARDELMRAMDSKCPGKVNVILEKRPNGGAPAIEYAYTNGYGENDGLVVSIIIPKGMDK